MTVLIPEAVGAAGEAAGAAEGATGIAGNATSAAASASTRGRAAKKAVPGKTAAKKTAGGKPAPRGTGGRHAKPAPKPTAGQKARLYAGKGAQRAKKQARAAAREGLTLPKFPLSGASGAAHKVVVGEFVVCVVLLGMTPIMTRTVNNGQLYAAEDFVRLTAVCVLFFVLALFANNPRSARIAAAFGALVTLGVLYNASQTLTALGNIFTNASAKKGGVSPASAGTKSVSAPTLTHNDVLGAFGVRTGQSAATSAPTGAPQSLNPSQGGSSSQGGAIPA